MTDHGLHVEHAHPSRLGGVGWHKHAGVHIDDRCAFVPCGRAMHHSWEGAFRGDDGNAFCTREHMYLHAEGHWAERAAERGLCVSCAQPMGEHEGPTFRCPPLLLEAPPGFVLRTRKERA